MYSRRSCASYVGADAHIGPYKTSVNSYCSASFERKANLPQLF